MWNGRRETGVLRLVKTRLKNLSGECVCGIAGMRGINKHSWSDVCLTDWNVPVTLRSSDWDLMAKWGVTPPHFWLANVPLCVYLVEIMERWFQCPSARRQPVSWHHSAKAVGGRGEKWDREKRLNGTIKEWVGGREKADKQRESCGEVIHRCAETGDSGRGWADNSIFSSLLSENIHYAWPLPQARQLTATQDLYSLPN